MKAVDILKKGRELLNKHGLFKGDFGEPKLSFCPRGACEYAEWGDMEFEVIANLPLSAADRYLNAATERLTGIDRVERFTDQETTTKKDVLNFFDRAIAKARRRHVTG